MAESDDMIVIYMPYHDELTVLRDLSGYMVEMVAMETKKIISPRFIQSRMVKQPCICPTVMRIC